MEISDCKLEMRVHDKKYHCNGTIIGIDSNVAGLSKSVLLGFLPSDVLPVNAALQMDVQVMASQKVLCTNCIVDFLSYPYCKWTCHAYLDEIIGNNTIAIKKNILDGYACSWCSNFFPMAEPNQPDGTLKCYSCRDSGRINKVI